MSQLLTRVGPSFGGDGTLPTLRGTRSAAGVVQQQSGKYAEAVLRGRVFSAVIGVAGQAPGTALGTTAHLALCNPAGSGFNYRMMYVSSGYLSGTLGAGFMALVSNNTASQAAITGGTAITPRNCLITSPIASSAIVQSGSTLPATPTMLEILFSLGAELATTASPFQQLRFDLDGAYMVAPGGIIALEGVTAAGTTPLLVSSFVWEEIAIGSE